LKYEGNPLVPQKIREFGIKPISIANFNRELVTARQDFQERDKSVGELMTAVKGDDHMV